MSLPYLPIINTMKDLLHRSLMARKLKDYFTIEAVESGLTVSLSKNTSYYRIDNGVWKPLSENEPSPEINKGQKIQFKILEPTISYGIGTFTVNKAFNVEGNIMSLLYGDRFVDQIDLNNKDYIFYNLFKSCTTLKSAERLILPATTLTNHCYSAMFYGCTSLTKAPVLPATTLVEWCYSNMFYGCTSLTETPELPATTLADNCYNNMFRGCTALKSAENLILPAMELTSDCYYAMFNGCTSLLYAPELSATTLATNCYSHMFSGCTSLIFAPELPATTLASSCYAHMFQGCTKLVYAPEVLPAMELTGNCYNYMFAGCTSLPSAPELPATKLAVYCYYAMFSGCTSLSFAPELPATKLADCCYRNMFDSCTSLRFAPKLPATKLASNCYYYMFNNCNSNYFTESPELPAATLANYCYSGMFYGCSNLSKITMLAADISATNCLQNWVYGVASSGTFVKNADTNITYGDSGIPSGWDEENKIIYSNKYFTIRASNNGNMTLYTPSSYTAGTLAYSLNNGSWVTFSSTQTLSLKTNDEVRVKCITSAYTRGTTSAMFSGACEYEVYGNIMSLLYGDDFIEQSVLTTQYSFRSLFYGQTNLKNAENLILPATTLKSNCYNNMFRDCSSLTTAPELPATKLTNACYQNMFYNCTRLTEAPELPATALASSCYSNMFFGCNSLAKAPELPATALASSCYQYMFADCTSLTSAPELPATTLKDHCYYCMFYNCTSLTKAPKLPATTLANFCYSGMFNGCRKLNKIIMLATDISTSSCLLNWVNNVAETGIFIKNPNMGNLSSGISGVPNGWTVLDYYEGIEYSTDYFTLHMLSDGNMTLYAPPSFTSGSLAYSVNDGDWTTFSSNKTLTGLTADDEVRVKCITSAYTRGVTNTMFSGTSTYEVYGNIMSLLYGDDFIGQTALTTEYTFKSLFYGQTNLRKAENLILPATQLKIHCYETMFQNCTGLTIAPSILPAMKLTLYCYASMFRGCSGLTEAPKLPATTLAQDCYNSMFSNCTKLVYAPVLPATTLVSYCYYYMFNGCTSLKEITMLGEPYNGSTKNTEEVCLYQWVVGVPGRGRFRKNPSLELNYNDNGIPYGWTEINDYSIDYFTLLILSDGDMTLYTPSSYTAETLAYSINHSGWTTFSSNTTLTGLTEWDNIRIKCETNKYKQTESASPMFSGTCEYEVYGNIMSLLYGDNFRGQTALKDTDCFQMLLVSQSTLKSAENLILPATSLTTYCYSSMFSGCNNLTKAPELPAIELADRCYNSMFAGCSNLAIAPELPATELASYCYYNMFQGCTSLTIAPKLPATTLASYCYSNMFFGCNSLAKAPELPATTLKSNCYNYMFAGCTNLTSAPELPATTLISRCYAYMFQGCTSLTTAPELSATTLATACYGRMFYGCSKLKKITMLATDISASNCLSSWVQDVALTGIFIKNPNMESLPPGVNGIPSGWTIQNYNS